jgi:hypothetical protein
VSEEEEGSSSTLEESRRPPRTDGPESPDTLAPERPGSRKEGLPISAFLSEKISVS